MKAVGRTLTRERPERLLEALASDQRVLASDLAARFGVSEDTVCRDLREFVCCFPSCHSANPDNRSDMQAVRTTTASS